MSETNRGGHARCAVCGKSLKNSGLGWRHNLFCSLECEQLAVRWRQNQAAAAAGHQGGAPAPVGKGAPRHAGGTATNKISPR